jgi:hypothetical protein
MLKIIFTNKEKMFLFVGFICLIVALTLCLHGSSLYSIGTMYDTWIPAIGAKSMQQGLSLHQQFHTPMGVFYNSINYISLSIINALPQFFVQLDIIMLSSTQVMLICWLLFFLIEYNLKTKKLYLTMLLATSTILQARLMGDIFDPFKILWSGVYNNNVLGLIILQLAYTWLWHLHYSKHKVSNYKVAILGVLQAVFAFIFLNFKINTFFAALLLNIAAFSSLSKNHKRFFLTPYCLVFAILIGIITKSLNYSYVAYFTEIKYLIGVKKVKLLTLIDQIKYIPICIFIIFNLISINVFKPLHSLSIATILSQTHNVIRLIKKEIIQQKAKYWQIALFSTLISFSIFFIVFGESLYSLSYYLIIIAIVASLSERSKYIINSAKIFLALIIITNLFSLGIIAYFKNYEPQDSGEEYIKLSPSNKPNFGNFITINNHGFSDLILRTGLNQNPHKNNILANIASSYKLENLQQPIAFHNIEYSAMIRNIISAINGINPVKDDKILLLGFTNPLPFFLDSKIIINTHHWIDLYITISPKHLNKLYPSFAEADFIYTPILTFDDSGDPEHQTFLNCAFYEWNLEQFSLVKTDPYGLLFAKNDKIKQYNLKKQNFLSHKQLVKNCAATNNKAFKRYN